ncbi:MAG: hypothetical protein IJC39_04255 [Firmicutes bacterium]|nr:hypothetical protein [Bacillota bacterium]
MSENYYKQYFEAQKAMFDAWEKNMKNATFNEDGSLKAFNPTEQYNAFIEKSKETAEAFSKNFTDPENLWKNANESYKAYYSIYQLWKKLSEKAGDIKNVNELYNEWQDEYFDYVKKNFLPGLPGYIKEMTEKFIDTAEVSRGVMCSFMKPWMDDEHMKNIFEGTKDPTENYLLFLKEWQDNYNQTYGKLFNAPAFGLNRDIIEKQMRSFDKFVKYSVTFNEFYTSVYKIGQDATKKVIEDYIAMTADNTQPKTYDEFYKYWSKNISAAYDKVFFSDDFSKLSGEIVDTMSRFKIEYDKLCESLLVNVPVPTKSDMKSLYKTVYELKKELRALKTEVAILKANQGKATV